MDIYCRRKGNTDMKKKCVEAMKEEFTRVRGKLVFSFHFQMPFVKCHSHVSYFGTMLGCNCFHGVGYNGPIYLFSSSYFVI